MEELPKTISVAAAAEVIGCHRKTLARRSREGTFPPIRRVGNRHGVVLVEDLEAFIRGEWKPAAEATNGR